MPTNVTQTRPCWLSPLGMYALLADLVLLLHAAFAAFVAFGGLLALRKPGLLPWHLASLAWGASIVGLGWICPLTPLENTLRQLAGQAGYHGGFSDIQRIRVASRLRKVVLAMMTTTKCQTF